MHVIQRLRFIPVSVNKEFGLFSFIGSNHVKHFFKSNHIHLFETQCKMRYVVRVPDFIFKAQRY